MKRERRKKLDVQLRGACPLRSLLDMWEGGLAMETPHSYMVDLVSYLPSTTNQNQNPVLAPILPEVGRDLDTREDITLVLLASCIRRGEDYWTVARGCRYIWRCT